MTNCSPVSTLQLSIHRTIFIIIQAASTTLLSPSATATSPWLHIGYGSRRIQGRRHIDSDSGPFRYIVCYILSRPNGRLFYSSTSPFIPPHSGMCRLIPLHVCNLWIDPSSELDLFYYPISSHLPYSLPFGAPFGPYSSQLKFAHHPSCSCSLRDADVQAPLSSSHFPRPPLISFR